MRTTWIVLGISVLVVIALAWFDHSGAQPPKTEPAKVEPSRARVVPVIVLMPGEKKEILLSTRCTVGLTRSGGLDVRETEGKERPGLESSKIWKRDGVTVEVPDFAEAAKVAAAPRYEPLKKKGLDAFFVKITAAQDAKLGLYDLHIADFTCSGTCETDLRVLVAAP